MKYAELEINGAERDLTNISIMGLELVHHATMLAIIMQDDTGIFVRYMPGNEVPIARRLAEVDWNAAARVTEEHC